MFIKSKHCVVAISTDKSNSYSFLDSNNFFIFKGIEALQFSANFINLLKLIIGNIPGIIGIFIFFL